MPRWLGALGALGVLALAIACKRTSTNHAPASAAASGSAARRVARSADRQHVGAGAFDLVSTDDGAALVWAHAGASVSLTVLDELGAERRTEPAFAEPDDAGAATSSISEIAAAARGNELGIAWLEQTGDAARTRGLVRPLVENGSAAPAIIEIGPVLTPVSVPRGNLAITSSKDRFLVLSRGQKSECIDATQSDCVSFGFHRLDGAKASAQSLPLTVPLPCDQNSVSFAVAGSRWYYGVCSRATGKPITTLFSIQSDPEYARADRILEGCLPIGALSQGNDLLVIGDCGGERRGVRVRGGNAETSDLRVDRLDAVCDAGHPLIHQLGPGGLSLTLDAPRDRLEAFLPAEYAAPASRAVWTGQLLLVASLKNASITLKGYRCDSTLLREVPLAAPAR
ncbi:MAG TPA: hypothetical protein VK745_16365 [Polyangiaceae bacterium]|nr:hypothetical protein [Polyangiaceae bacterium]